MTEKRFSLSKDTEWWFVQDNAIQVNKYGYRDDLTGEDEYRGLHQELTEQETVDLLNELYETILSLHKTIEELDNCQKGQSHRINDLYLENKQLKQRCEFLKRRCNEYWEEARLNTDYFE